MSTLQTPPMERLYALTNAKDGNGVAVFVRQGSGNLAALTADPSMPLAADFTVRPVPAFPTGGLGAGGPLISQGAVTLSGDKRFLFAVSAGSNEVSSFLVTPSGLHFVSKVSSGGVLPVSVTSFGNLVYVVNAVNHNVAPTTPGLDGEGFGQIAGFSVGINGALTPIEGSIRALSSTNSSPAQISFNADGTLLVVTEFNAHRITVFQVEEDGRTGGVVENPSAGIGPFGFAFNSKGVLVVSEAGTPPNFESGVSSYEVGPTGKLAVISGAVPTNQIATCWIAHTADARFAYASNTGDGTITGFSVGATGKLTRLNPDGPTAFIGEAAELIDVVISGNGAYLDVLSQGSQTIMTFRIGDDGSLDLFSCVGNLPPLAVGLAIG